MNRNPRRALIVATLLTLGAGACTDTTELPITTITDTNYFNDPSSYRAFLAKLYSGLAVSGQRGPAGNGDIKGIDEGFSQYLRLYWEAQELPTDEAVIAWGDPGLPELNTQLWASSNPFVVAMYYRIAFQVSLANEFLRQTTDAVLAERNVSPQLAADIQVFRAEARFLRALSYWHGIDLFGNIPLVTEADPLGAEPPAQSTRQALYDFVVSELTAIRPLLPLASPGTYGRATDAAASMLLAHIYLNGEVYTGTPQYAQALAAAQAAIAGPFTLDPSYRHLFQADNNTSPEIIFPVVQDGQRTQTFGGTTFLVHASCGGSMNAADYGVDGCWFGLRLKPEAYNRYLAGDQRASFFWTDGQTVNVASISNYNNGIPAPKFVNKTSLGANGSNATHPDTDFPMFRLGDAYLIYAEAHLRGGGGDPVQALAYVNALRQRAYGNASGDITAPELTLPFLLDERGRELLFEAHRRSDLVRYGLFTGGAYVWSWKGGAQAGTATDTFRDLYPLPASELTTNPKLTQNPGY
ncbi:MAG: starch-binding outer membrane protein SusD/RagB family [Gemmatimonadales bacterium]|nr:starch-binding outer membrane protein SusD/RagB family [Gemmatimonadales bacterium]